MAYGFQVIGSHGVTQIDQDYTNYSLVTKGSVSLGAGGNTFTLGSLQAPMLAIRCTSPVYLYSNGAIPSTTYTAYAPAPVTLEYYLFDRRTSASSDPYGLRIYRTDGSLAFDSGWKVMRIGAVTTLPTGSIAGSPVLPSGSLSAPYSGTWAACLTCWRQAAVMISSAQHRRYYDGMTCTNSGATVTEQIIQPIGGVHHGDIQSTGGALLLVDVTGY